MNAEDKLSDFEEKFLLARKLLQEQPVRNQLINFLKDYHFEIDSLSNFHYYLKDKSNNPFTIYLHIETLKIVYVEFTEPSNLREEITKYLTKKEYSFLGSQHLCDYWIEKGAEYASLMLMPNDMEKQSFKIHVSN